MQSSLSRRVLAQTGLDDTAHDHFVDIVGLHPRALHCFANDDRAQVSRLETLQGAKKLSHWRAYRTNDDWLFDRRHLILSLKRIDLALLLIRKSVKRVAQGC